MMTSSGRRFWLQAAILTGAVGALLWSQTGSSQAQAYTAGSNQVVVNYDVLNALPADTGAATGAPAYATAPAAATASSYNGAYPTSNPKASFTPGSFPAATQQAPSVAPGFTPFSDVVGNGNATAPHLKQPSATKQKPISSKKANKSTLELPATKSSSSATVKPITVAAATTEIKSSDKQAAASAKPAD
ncbi:MAG TPA: hypothetical protein VN229_00430, partial [Terriglobales bacterium]|nr:hypothetical protein [Terriglobales bacterium]